MVIYPKKIRWVRHEGHVRGTRRLCRFELNIQKGKYDVAVTGCGWRITLKWVTKKCRGRILIGLIQLRIKKWRNV
jgi:hypothetical protein